MRVIGSTKDDVHDRTGWRRIVSAAATPEEKNNNCCKYDTEAIAAIFTVL